MDLDPEKLARICRQEGVSLLVLFGSRAGGKALRRSDTDLAVMFDKPSPGLDDQARLEQRLREVLVITGRIDLVVLNDVESTTLRREIAHTGKALFDKDGEQFAEFAVRAMKDFADFAPFRRLRREVLMRKTKP